MSRRGVPTDEHGRGRRQWDHWKWGFNEPTQLVTRYSLESICQNSSCYWLVCNDNIEDDGLLVGGQFYGEYNGKQSILVLRSYHPAITLLHFTGVFWSDCRHSYSLVVSDFVSHMALDFWKDSLCKRRRRVTYHVPYPLWRMHSQRGKMMP